MIAGSNSSRRCLGPEGRPRELMEKASATVSFENVFLIATEVRISSDFSQLIRREGSCLFAKDGVENDEQRVLYHKPGHRFHLKPQAPASGNYWNPAINSLPDFHHSPIDKLKIDTRSAFFSRTLPSSSRGGPFFNNALMELCALHGIPFHTT